MQENIQNIAIDKKSKRLLIWGVIAFIVATIIIVFLPLLVTQNSWWPLTVDKPNEIGDTLGGIMGPIVALLGVLLTFLAFWAQYAANQEQKQQFLKALTKQEDDKKEQQFESQFFEMLNLHKQNVDELKTTALLDGVEVQRRKVFETMANEFSTMLSYVQAANFDLTQDDIENCYHIFFWGYNIPERQNLSEDAQRWLRLEGVQSNTPMINFINHRGFSASLGHYFRHLYMMVKFVAESKVITEYDTKMKYLKILRAQLSNHEQIMLFYNWISTYGSAWEEENGNHFFTEYKMIHNLWIGELYQHQFIVNKVNNLIDRYNQNPKSTPLFEFQQNDFNLKMKDIEITPLSDLQF